MPPPIITEKLLQQQQQGPPYVPPAVELDVKNNSRNLNPEERALVQSAKNKLRQQGREGEADELQYPLDHNMIRFSCGYSEFEWYGVVLSDDMIYLSPGFFKKGFDSADAQFQNLWRSGILLHELVHIHQHHGTDPGNQAMREILALNQQKNYLLHLIQNCQDPQVLQLLLEHLKEVNKYIELWIMIHGQGMNS